MKKIISQILAAAMLVISIPTSAFAAADHNGGGHHGMGNGGHHGGNSYALCNYPGCDIRGNHQHDGTTFSGHHNNDGHNHSQGGNGGSYALCNYPGCNISGNHQHDGVNFSGHHNNDGHNHLQGCNVSGCTLSGNHSHHCGSTGSHYARCEYPDCNITGNHQHDGQNFSGHYSGDGHAHHTNGENYPHCLDDGCALIGIHDHNGITYNRENHAAKFLDIPARVGETSSAWYYDAVDALTGLGVIAGTDDYSFSPDNNVRRSEFTKFLFGIAQVLGKDPQQVMNVPFNDLPQGDYWATGYIGWAYENNIVKGVGNGQFKPNDYITRQDISVMMENFLSGYLGMDLNGDIQLNFTDSNKISPYASDSVDLMIRCGLMQGKGNGIFAPLEHTPRCQAAQILYNTLQKIQP